MSLPFPKTGYITSIVPLDCWIQIATEVATETKRHCAVILIGNGSLANANRKPRHWRSFEVISE
jgi:hypothetical protein